MRLAFTIDKDIASYQDLVHDLTPVLGTRFGESMKNWCGIGHRPYPLPTWQVYLVRDGHNHPVGVCSYYQQEADPAGRFWIGWIGVPTRLRRRGIASAMFTHVRSEVQQRGARELRVYTGTAEAESFYIAMGIAPAGRFRETGLEQAAASGDEAVLTVQL